MFKLKNYKYLLLLMLFAFAGQNAWAGGSGNNWWCYQIEVDVKLVTGEGLVYDPDPGEVPGTIEVGEKNKNGGYSKSTQHSLGENRFYYQQHSPNVDNGGKGDEWVMKSAVPNTQNPDVSYIFKGWMYAGNAGDGAVVKHVSGNNAEFTVNEYLTESNYVESLGGYAFYAKTPNKCKYTGENGVSTADGADHVQSHNDYPPVYTNNAVIYALFEKQELTPAVTIQYDVDKCEVEYPVDYQTNAIGNTITITARRKADTEDKGWEKDFVGWADEDGNIVSTDNPWTLNIEKKAVYRAVIEDRYRFFRIKNYGEPHRYVSAISDEASSNNFMDLMDNIELLRLNDNRNEIIYDAGSIVQIDVLQNPYQSSATYVDITVQDSKASKFYKFESGVTINSLPYDYTTKSWNFKAPLVLFRDDSGVPKMQGISDNYSKWIIEHLDLDLETKENYFSLDPNKLIEVDGKYYTTLRTSWNILFNPEQMTPYVVTEVDEVNGTFEMEAITDTIIPAGTPVIIETKSNNVEENRMVPTLTNAASGAVPSGNLLQHSEKYFPNQPAPVSNCKGLYKNDNGQLAFGDALNTVNGNEAYLSVANEVVHDVQPVLTETTLANLLENGEIGPNYKITDLTCVYIQGNTLYCKDDNHALKKSVIAEGEEDYIKTYTALQNGDWDQSNWIAINLPEGSSIGTDYMEAIFDHRLNNVVGRLKSKVNPEFDATLKPTAGEKNTYNENTYITCNFSGEHQPGVVNGEDVNLFFVAPKPMEIAHVEWAMWDEGSGMFIMPHKADDSGLHGAFLPNFSMLENVSNPNPQDGYGYHFPALIKLTEATPQGSAPVLAASNSSTWTVYPLEWNTDTPTAIDNMQAGKTVTRVVYYNLMGVASDVPHPGINIVEKRYSDGSRTVEKVIR